jgi:Spy/CpxP family protein refolding chaperone
MKSSMEKRMLRTAAVLLCGAGLAMSPAMAQQNAPPPPDAQTQGPPPGGRMRGASPEKRAEMMQSHLNLSADQTSKVRSILEEEQSKTEALRSDTSLSKKDRRQQMKAIHDDGDTKIEALLNPDQKTQFADMQAKERQHMQGRRKGGAGGQGDDSAPPPSL